jgi:hypothetical protein
MVTFFLSISITKQFRSFDFDDFVVLFDDVHVDDNDDEDDNWVLINWLKIGLILCGIK